MAAGVDVVAGVSVDTCGDVPVAPGAFVVGAAAFVVRGALGSTVALTGPGVSAVPGDVPAAVSDVVPDVDSLVDAQPVSAVVASARATMARRARRTRSGDRRCTAATVATVGWGHHVRTAD